MAILNIIDSIRILIDSLNDSNMLELCAILTNRKKIARFLINDQEYLYLQELLPMLGLHFKKSDFRYYSYRSDSSDNYFITNVEWNDTKGNNFLILIAKDIETVESGMILESSGNIENELGNLYEYPLCCVQAYKEILNGNDWKKQIIERTLKSENSYLSNKLAILFSASSSFLPDYFPCSLSCEKAQKLGELYQNSVLEIGYNELYSRLLYKSKLPILVTKDYSFIQLSQKCLEIGNIVQNHIIEVFPTNQNIYIKKLYIDEIDNFKWVITENKQIYGKLFTFH